MPFALLSLERLFVLQNTNKNHIMHIIKPVWRNNVEGISLKR